MRRGRLIALAAVALLGLVVFAVQVIAPRSNVLLPPRASNGVEYVLYVHVPDACSSGGCPALYLLDGERWLPAFARNADALAQQQDMTPAVIVGIGYRDLLGTERRRKRDFTPGPDGQHTGGADAYLDVLENDIIPFTEANLPIRRDYRVIAGHSYGGLFATYALARKPDLFDDYMVLSPAFWFDDDIIFRTDFVASDREKIVFLAAETARGDNASGVAANVLRMTDALNARANVRVSRATIVDRTHDGMVAPAARAGLRALFSLEQQ